MRIANLFAKLFLTVVGVAFGIYCLFLASLGAIRLHGWTQTGRLVPSHYPRLDRYDVISLNADPLRFVLEIGGNLFLVAMALFGLVAVILTFRRRLEWTLNWPDVLPFTLTMVFLATASASWSRLIWITAISAIKRALRL